MTPPPLVQRKSSRQDLWGAFQTSREQASDPIAEVGVVSRVGRGTPLTGLQQPYLELFFFSKMASKQRKQSISREGS